MRPEFSFTLHALILPHASGKRITQKHPEQRGELAAGAKLAKVSNARSIATRCAITSTTSAFPLWVLAQQAIWFRFEPIRASSRVRSRSTLAAAAVQAREHLERWMHSAMRSRLEPFKSFVRLLRGHLDGVLAWTKLRLSNGALEGMNNKIKLVSHRAFGFRGVEHYVAAIYHCCAQLPLPQRS